MDSLTFLYILIAVLIFCVIIIIHELGHFAAAKLCGIKVNEFSLGMGPKLFSWGRGETKYSLRALPVGGFVSMEGEDDSSSDPRAFRNKKVWQRLIVVLAGAVMNLVLGFLILIILTASSDVIISTTVAEFYPAVDSETGESTPALSNSTGLMEGDRIVRVNGMRIYTDTDISYQFQVDEDAVFDMTVIRDGQRVELPAVEFRRSVLEDGSSYIHIDFSVVGERVTPASVISYSSGKFVSVARIIWLSLTDLIKGKYSINDLSGPVGIVGAIGDVVSSTQEGIPVSQMLQDLFSFVAFITINVGIFNLLPVPALDGARALFLVIEAIRRKPIKPEHEGLVHFIGMAALLIVMLLVTVSDISELF